VEGDVRPRPLFVRPQGRPLRRAEQRGREGFLDGQGLHAGAAHGDRGQRAWLKQDLAKIDKKTAIIVFSHSPLYKLYEPWNFWTDDAEQVQAILKPFQTVTVIHGHTHQLLTNRIGNIQFHGMLSTAWPWPYAPEGLPAYTVQMLRSDPFNQFDGCGDGTVDVLAKGRVDKHYNLWTRNPREVTAAELAGKSLPGGGYQGPSY
jgi:3',5'-cyclic AMP phosphodiesterase CpdA